MISPTLFHKGGGSTANFESHGLAVGDQVRAGDREHDHGQARDRGYMRLGMMLRTSVITSMNKVTINSWPKPGLPYVDIYSGISRITCSSAMTKLTKVLYHGGIDISKHGKTIGLVPAMETLMKLREDCYAIRDPEGGANLALTRASGMSMSTNPCTTLGWIYNEGMRSDTISPSTTVTCMIESTRPVSALNLRGDEEDDPVLHPVHLPGVTKAKNASRFQDATSATSTLSPESSAVSVYSPHYAMRALPRLGYDSGYHGSLDISRGQSHPRSEGALDKFLLKHPVQVNRVNTEPSNRQSIKAVDVNATYQPPPERLPKPVACLFIRFPQSDDSYYRAVYLTERTTRDLAEKISQKQRINPDRIVRIAHVNQASVKIIVDDGLVRELPEAQDMVAEFAQVPTPDANVDIPSTGFEVTLSF